MAEVTIAQLEDTLRKSLENHFQGMTIERISVARDFDFDDSPILRVLAIYSPEELRIDPSARAAMVRVIRPRLLELAEERFPMIRLLSRRDAEELSPEAA
ncbi:MAG: hypothetical protein AAFZ38_11670 [Myxococcota bacterium]